MCFKIKFIFIVVLAGFAFQASGQSLNDELPLVFTVGEHGKMYEQLVSECETPLVELSSNSMDSAYVYWLQQMGQLEVHADTSGFDIKGVKIWINVFWNPDGSIKHIAFFPKKSSRNVDFDELKILLNAFAKKNRISLNCNSCFSHFGSASFPTHADYLLNR